MSTAENNKRIAKNSVYLYLRMFFCLAVTLFTTRVLLKSLGVLDYGIYNIVGGVVAFMAFIRSAMANGFQRFYNISLGQNSQEELRKVFSASIAVQLIICLFFVIVAETVGLWFLNTQLVIPDDRMFAANIVYQSSIIVFLLTIITSPYNAIVIAYEKMNVFAVVSIIEVLLKLLIAYFIVIGSDRLILYAFLIVVIHIVLPMIYISYTRKLNSSLVIKPLFDKSLIKKLASFSGWNLFGSLAHTAKGQGINIVLNMFFDPTINAARGVAYQVLSGVSQFFQSFQTASRPQVIKYYAQGKHKEMLNLTYTVSKFSFMLLWLIDLPILFTCKYFIALWLGDNMPPYAPLFTNIVLITVTIECFSHPISTLVHATGKMRNFQMYTSFTILLVVPLAYLVLSLGAPPEYALYCSLFLAPIVQMVRLFLVKRLVPLSLNTYFKTVVLPALLVSSVSYLIVYLISTLVEIHSIVLAIICLFVATLTIILFGCSSKEKQVMLSFIGKYVKNVVSRKRNTK